MRDGQPHSSLADNVLSRAVQSKRQIRGDPVTENVQGQRDREGRPRQTPGGCLLAAGHLDGILKAPLVS